VKGFFLFNLSLRLCARVNSFMALAVNVVDIFGNDTMTIVEVTV